MSVIDDAITRLRYHALATKYDSSHNVNYAPDYPPEDGMMKKPFAITHIKGGEMDKHSWDVCRHIMQIGVDFHVSLDRLKVAYSQLDVIIPDFVNRLGGDPDLNASVDTIVFPLTYEVSPAQWNDVTTLMCAFNIPVKFIEDPTT